MEVSIKHRVYGFRVLCLFLLLFLLSFFFFSFSSLHFLETGKVKTPPPPNGHARILVNAEVYGRSLGWLWVFEFDPFRWENRGGFTYTDQRPFEVLPPEQKKKKKKKKKADLRRERGGSSEPPEPPLRTGLHKHPFLSCSWGGDEHFVSESFFQMHMLSSKRRGSDSCLTKVAVIRSANLRQLNNKATINDPLFHVVKGSGKGALGGFWEFSVLIWVRLWRIGTSGFLLILAKTIESIGPGLVPITAFMVTERMS